jgi:trehalose synthase
MARLEEVAIGPRSPGQFEPVVGPERMARFLEAARRMRSRLSGRVVWNVNSTAAGGGVAELLRSLLAYARGAGFDARWVVVQGPREFFLVTKQLHNAIHGVPGDGPELDRTAEALYEEVLHENALELAALIRPRDVVLLHDPQTAGLIPHLVRAGALVVWRCHIGADTQNEHSEMAWRFLAPHLEAAHKYVFTRKAFVPSVCDPGRTEVIPPTIDPRSPKNQDLSSETSRAILVHTGIIEGPSNSGARDFVREDGSPGRVDRSADVIRLGRAPMWDTPLVVQVSRWDTLKDPVGVLKGFARLVDGRAPRDAELVLAGPNVHAVTDDPEGPAVFEQVLDVWRSLRHGDRRRIHLVNLPMTDVEENAAIVNALQRHAAVVIQKSLKEGFGLTVAEAMWKGRAVLASAVGGIQDQIENGESGLLIQEATDLDAYAGALRRLLEDPTLASSLGRAARERVREHFLGLRSLEQWGALIERIDELAGADSS